MRNLWGGVPVVSLVCGKGQSYSSGCARLPGKRGRVFTACLSFRCGLFPGKSVSSPALQALGTGL